MRCLKMNKHHSHHTESDVRSISENIRVITSNRSMPPKTTMPMQTHQWCWWPYGPPTSFAGWIPNGINNSSPYSEKLFIRHSHKSHAFQPLQYKNNTWCSNAQSSLTLPWTTDYACSTIQLPCESSCRPLHFLTPVLLREESVTTLIILWYIADVQSDSVQWPWCFMSDGILWARQTSLLSTKIFS